MRGATFVKMFIFVLPLAFCFAPTMNFYKDWTNNAWLMGYFGEYLRQHRAFPSVINADRVAGLPYPAFYGFLLYPLAGILSMFFGGDAALRLTIVVFSAIEFKALDRLSKRLSFRPVLQLAFTALAFWSVYSMTNLYHRSAIAEYVAVCILTSIVCLWLEICFSPEEKPTFKAAAAFYLLALLPGIHPITALFGTLFLTVLAAVTFPLWRGRLPAMGNPFFFGSVFAVLTALPWLYMVAKFTPVLNITNFPRMSWPDSIDAVTTRLAFFPFDPRTSADNFNDVSTPFLDAQINMPLSVVFIFLFLRGLYVGNAAKLKTIAAVSLAGAFTVFVFSVSDKIWNFVPSFLEHVQYNYRLVSYVDLFSLTGTAALLFMRERKNVPWSKPAKIILSVCLIWSVLVTATKLQRAWIVSHDGHAPGTGFNDSRDELVHLPETFYGSYNYDVGQGYKVEVHEFKLPLVDRDFPVGTGARFGETETLRFKLDTPSFIVTDVRAFPWSRLLIGGKEVTDVYLAAKPPMDLQLAVLPASLTGDLNYETRVDKLWVALRTLSFLAFFLGTAAGLYFISRRKIASRWKTNSSIRQSQ